MTGFEGFGLFCGHQVGDFLLQSDWMSKWKAAVVGATEPQKDDLKFGGWKQHRQWYRWRPFLACTLHCLLYTVSVWAFSFWWMPWWGLAAIFFVHWPIDRYRLPGKFMRATTWQREFASPGHPLWPHGPVYVDQAWHYVTLFLVAAAWARWG
jgi:hypothetical protein